MSTIDPGSLPSAPDPWNGEPVRTRRPWWFWVATGVGGIVLFFSAAFVALYYLYAPDLPITADRLGEMNRTPSITLLDSNGKVFATRGAAFGYRVKLDEMPAYLPAAFIVTEDRRFYSHSGIDYRGMLRAFFANWRAGGVVQGGSTITQQLAKNMFLKPERTMSRKFQELFLSFWLERHYSKDEILTLYLNRIYLGSGAYGVDAAAREYFGKSVRNVTLAEAAMLAALTRAPSKYAPDTNLKLAQQRANLVVKLLHEDGQINDDDARKASAKPAAPVLKEGAESANYFADFVMDQLVKLDIRPDKDLVVRTTIDPKLQAAAEQNLIKILDRDGKGRGASQAALVAMEPNGAVRSIVGGKDYTNSTFNRAYQARRQPGSSFKPFVFMAAIEHGLTPDDQREDAPYENRGWSPQNYDGQYLGYISLREALAKSINTVAVRIADEVGRRNIIAVAQRLGIKSPLEPNRSLPLGTSEVTLFEMTQAFAAFANNGNRVDPYAILEVKTADGTVLYQYRAPPAIAVMNQQTLQDMNQMMYEVVQNGTGQRASLDPRPVAAKTGTSQEWRDAWFVGYTADYVAGVWVGNDDNTSMKKIVGGSIPAAIWKAYMLAAHKNVPIHGLPGAAPYGEGEDYAQQQDQPDNPWVERDGGYADRTVPDDDRPGVIEDFFDRLFGGDDEDERRRPPSPPPPPRYAPQSNLSAPGQDEGTVEAHVEPGQSNAPSAHRAPPAPDPDAPPPDEPDAQEDPEGDPSAPY